MARDTHSRFAPSAADRWANCQLSLQPVPDEELILTAREDREDAALGSACHALGAACLNEHRAAHDFLLDDRQFHKRDVTPDMADSAGFYVDYCRETYIKRGYEYFVEHHIEAPDIHEDCYGTADFRAFSAERKHLAIVDYKSGHTYYDPRSNQLAIYANGELRTLEDMGYEVEQITCTIVQPLHVKDPVRSHTYDVKTLKRIGRDLRKATTGSAKKAGAWCGQCSHAHYCPVLADYANEVLPDSTHGPEDFREMVAALTPELLTEIMDRQKVVGLWFSAVSAWATQLAILGQEFEGYELKTERRGHRAYINPEHAETVLHAAFGDAIYEPRVMRSPAQIEKVFPEAASLMKGRPGVPGLTERPKLATILKRKGEKDD